jgi:oxygen-independent coproporphyrinogen-3 oxidase
VSARVTLPVIGRPTPDPSLAELLGSSTAPSRASGVYVHVPFCFHKCHYCDFYSFVDTEDRQEAYVVRLEGELEALSAWARAPLESVFVGGGTPTLLAPPLLGRALRAVRERLPLSLGVEWTVEANPETVDDAVADMLASAGVNRVSLGAQSFNSRHLKTLERWHDPASVGRAIGRLRTAGISRISIDLIFGIPGQSLDEWGGDLTRAIDLGTDHLSCYGLTYEPNTAMAVRMSRGEFEPCDEGLEASMLEEAAARLSQAGFDRYEVSNWARVRNGDRVAERCRHNMLYWRNRDWLAAGPSASGHVQGLRWKNVPRLGDWLASQGMSPVVDVERGDPDTVAAERLMMGLRLTDGIPEAEMSEILCLGTRVSARVAAIDRACASGLMERREGALRFTPAGLLTMNCTLKRLM